MYSKEYIELCKRTESCDEEAVLPRLTGTYRLLHAVIGMATEAGEIQDLQINKPYRWPDNRAKYKLELGDFLWYAAIACDVFDWTFEELEDENMSDIASKVRMDIYEIIEDVSYTQLSILTGELCDYVKKYIFYGKEIDIPNFKLKLADALWFIRVTAKYIECRWGDLMLENVYKLKKRYPEKFDETLAKNHDGS